jgi:hypothetical protein
MLMGSRMETTEKIVEAYVRHVKRWMTISNIKCSRQYEIDLIAIDPVKLERYHIESGVVSAQAYSSLTNKGFDPEAANRGSTRRTSRRA